MKRKGKKSKKVGPIDNVAEDENIPKSFVIHHGVISSNIRELLSDFKFLMRPNTADKLKARKRNSIKDFISMSGPYKVSHLIIFSQTENGVILKLGRLPQGPTLCFCQKCSMCLNPIWEDDVHKKCLLHRKCISRSTLSWNPVGGTASTSGSIESYTLKKDILSNQKNQMLDMKMFLNSPCLMTNLQPTDGKQHLQLCGKIFLDMFPSINPAEAKTHQIKRCCLIHYEEGTETFDLRHYAIRTRPVGISKATRKMIGNKVPNLSAFNEISDFVAKSEVLSDSEWEDDPSMQVEIQKKKKKKEVVSKQKSVIKLSEIGPRLTMKLVKIESGLCEGTVLHHSYIHKTPEEILNIEKKKKKEERLRKLRKKQQEENVKRKEEEKESHKQKCLKGMGIDSVSATQNKTTQDDGSEDDDDAEYYRQEVGEEPDADLFKRKFKSSFKSNSKPKFFKKRRQ